ncbi:MAG: ATP synthase subunit B [bacterium]
MKLYEQSQKTVFSLRGPLLFLNKVISVRMGEIVKIVSNEGYAVEGEVLKIDNDVVLVQIYGESSGFDISNTTVIFTDAIKQVSLSKNIVGRIFNGAGTPLDSLPQLVPEKTMPVTGYPINPAARAVPKEFIETGFSAIDGLNTLVKGQKLPIFSSAGLPAKEMVSFILKNANIGSESAKFVVVFIAMGLTFHEYIHYRQTFEELGLNFVSFVNLADEPVMERLLSPRFGLTVAEYLAFEKGMDVLVVMSDMTSYCDALREISTAREELPGRRGYPGYMYSDLASLYERAGRIKGIEGSVTIVPVLTMPEDDITHPIPDLTGYITEGQLVLSRDLHFKGIFPPIDVLPSLSRLMQRGIGKGNTREDHRKISNELYKYYAKGCDLRRLEAVVGREGMTEEDRKLLDFADDFEKGFIHQGSEKRRISDTLDIGTKLLEKYRLL